MKKHNKITEQSDHYGYEDMNAQPLIDNEMIYRKKKTVLNEDSDHYGYNDSNTSPEIDTTDVAPFMGIEYRKHKKNTVHTVRKKKPVKKCKCRK